MGVKSKRIVGKDSEKICKVLNLDSCTPDYIVYKETDIERISEITGRRSIKFEEKVLKDGERKLVMDCIKEKEMEGMKSAATEEREKCFRQNGYSSEGIRILREEGRSVADSIRRREKERLGQ